MKATDTQLEGASSSCERWEWRCAGLVVLAVLAEIVIACVHPPYDSALNEWGTTLADAAIALGIVGEVIFGRLDARIQTELRRRSNELLASATKTAAQANERAAEARKQAAEAQLAFEKFRAPRFLTAEQLAGISEKLKRYAGQQFTGAVAPGIGDASPLWRQIARALRDAGWVGPPSDSPAAIPAITRPGIVVMFSTATFVAEASVPFDVEASVMVRAEALSSALNEEGIDAVSFPARGSAMEANPNAIRIEIGPKP
jgi:hypothetical protein